ncbi:unnamed protein product [Rotaria socialis]|uniref:Uncharacterized protein n=1 Tax=Rotaria socialis TaxID=392032 RepID=A0A821TEN7_9BILA|nr:unnamed protein product [Rotaria socialis]
MICDQIGIQLLTRDYSEVQKGKDICGRVCGVAKARTCSWISNGNDLLSANDIKESMEYAGGIKNTKITVAEIISGMGCLGKTNVPNISTIRPIEYNTKCMKVFKASNIGKDASVPYKNIDFSTNMRLTSAFTVPINDEDHAIVSKKIRDRAHRLFFMCPLSGCTSTFESSADLDLQISTNLHKVPPQNPRTSNDIARRLDKSW